MRPAELSSDTASTEPVLLHGLDWLWATCRMRPDYVALLQCTSPLRCSAIIDRAVSKALETGCDAVVGVHETIEHFFCGDLDGDRLEMGYDPQNRPRTQDIDRKYRENGSTYVTRSEFLRRTGCRMGGDTRAVVMTPTEGLDIDHFHDLMLAQHYLEQRRHTTGGFARLPLI